MRLLGKRWRVYAVSGRHSTRLSASITTHSKLAARLYARSLSKSSKAKQLGIIWGFERI